MSSLKLKHSGGNSVSIAAPSSNPASNRTLTVPSNADGTILTTGSSDADRYKAGEIVQVVTSEFTPNAGSGTQTFTNGTYTSMSATGLTAAITPKFADSKIIFDTSIYCNLNDEDGYTRWDIYDTTNSRSFHSNTYIAAGHYNLATDDWENVHIRCVGTATNTNAMTLQVRVQVFSGGTLNFSWSGSDNRLVTMTEIKV